VIAPDGVTEFRSADHLSGSRQKQGKHASGLRLETHEAIVPAQFQRRGIELEEAKPHGQTRHRPSSWHTAASTASGAVVAHRPSLQTPVPGLARLVTERLRRLGAAGIVARMARVSLLSIAWIVIAASASAQTTAIERITIRPEGAAALAADYRHGGSRASAVIFFPMCSPGAKEGWSPVADRLLERGVSSLVVSYTWARESWQANADAVVTYLQSRSGGTPPLAVAGSSCGVDMALSTASARPDAIRAVVALTGPHNKDEVAFIRSSPTVAVYSGSGETDGPAAGWARELRAASAHPDSTLVLVGRSGHGTDLFGAEPSLAPQIADWLAARLRAK
jgi:hypothetical protein